MTWSPNASIDALLAERARDLVNYVVVFDGRSTVYSQSAVTWPDCTTKQILIMQDFEGAEADSAQGQFRFGSCRFSLLDKAGEVTTLLKELDLRGVHVTVYIGGKGVAQADYEAIGVFMVTAVVCREYGLFEFTCTDPFPQFQRDLFVNLGNPVESDIIPTEGIFGSEVYPGVGDTKVYIDAYAGEDLAVGDYVMIRYKENYHFTTIAALKVGEQRAKVTLTDSLTFRAKSGSVLVKCARLRGNPVNILVRLLLADFALAGDIQTNFPLDAVGGVLSDDPPDGLGVPSTLVDSAQIIAERDAYLSTAVGEVIATQSESGRPYIERFCWGLCSLIVTRAGKLGIKCLRQPYTTGATPAITAATSAFWTYDLAPSDFRNKIIVRGDEFDGDYVDMATVQDDALVATHGPLETTVDSPWLRSYLSGATQGAALGARLLSRLALGREQVTASGFLGLLELEPGDVVSLTHPEMPDRSTGLAMSGTAGEVASVSPQLGQGSVAVAIWLYGGGRVGLIAPDAQADYGAASAEEQATYAFISADDGTMPGGDAGYRIA